MRFDTLTRLVELVLRHSTLGRFLVPFSLSKSHRNSSIKYCYSPMPNSFEWVWSKNVLRTGKLKSRNWPLSWAKNSLKSHGTIRFHPFFGNKLVQKIRRMAKLTISKCEKSTLGPASVSVRSNGWEPLY